MSTLCLITRFMPKGGDPLPSPLTVASITCDPRITGRLSSAALLAGLAAKLGLFQYEIVDSEDRDVPGHQFDLFPSR